MRAVHLLLLSAILSISLAACTRHDLPDVRAPSTVEDFTEGYQLEPGNRIRIMVFNENNLSGEFVVDPSGNVAIPLVGTVPAKGATSKAMAQRVADQLVRSGYMRDPKIAVEIITFRPFYVLGEVKQPGEFQYSIGMTVLSAVARAGGYDYRAREGEVILGRVVNGKQAEYRADERTPILPGDIVRVVERYF
ncbi:MAG TPA: polysaccharide biosynthesis/export family protein [Magnetospirillum sp.]|nr:polysaccharide biosynthesis/export family protein [Magnetospirillum sp.]